MAGIWSTVEEFARLRAMLDDPFQDREVVFAQTGLDERSYAALVEEWRVQLARSIAADDDIGERFTRAYRCARTAKRSRSQGHDAAEDPRFLNERAQPWRAEAAQVSLSANAAERALSNTDGAAPTSPISAATTAGRSAVVPALKKSEDWSATTMEITPLGALKPSLPFANAGPPPAGSPSPVHGPSLANLPFKSGAPGPFAPPAEPHPAPSPTSALPQPAAPAPGPDVPPGKRLIRFDPQTGQPLPSPIWVDATSTGAKRRS